MLGKSHVFYTDRVVDRWKDDEVGQRYVRISVVCDNNFTIEESGNALDDAAYFINQARHQLAKSIGKMCLKCPNRLQPQAEEVPMPYSWYKRGRRRS